MLDSLYANVTRIRTDVKICNMVAYNPVNEWFSETDFSGYSFDVPYINPLFATFLRISQDFLSDCPKR